MNDMKRFRLPVASLLLAVWVATVGASEGLAPMPVAVAESEAFEAVGRLSDEGLVWFIDRADSNAPVLDARLEVEANGQTQVARFRPEQGDYLIADAGWLKALRQPGEHALALTLLAGDDSDLLTASLDVHADEADHPLVSTRSLGWLPVLGGLLIGVLWWRRRKAPGVQP